MGRLSVGSQVPSVCSQFFYQMETCGVKPNRHTMCALIDGCGRERLVAKAFGIYGMMQAKVRPSSCWLLPSHTQM